MTRIRILLTGKTGQVGYEPERSLQGLGEIIAPTRTAKIPTYIVGAPSGAKAVARLQRLSRLKALLQRVPRITTNQKCTP